MYIYEIGIKVVFCRGMCGKASARIFCSCSIIYVILINVSISFTLIKNSSFLFSSKRERINEGVIAWMTLRVLCVCVFSFTPGNILNSYFQIKKKKKKREYCTPQGGIIAHSTG